jgi:hypothetical protein
MTTTQEVGELFEQYGRLGFKAIKCAGYHPEHNTASSEDARYKRAKQPTVRLWTSSGYKGLTSDECLKWTEKGGWIGWLIPVGLIVLDIDGKEWEERLNAVMEACRKEGKNPPVHRTNKGVHIFFSNTTPISGKTEGITKNGIPVTFRSGGANQLILAPVNGRSWQEPLNGSIPAIPDELRPGDGARSLSLSSLKESSIYKDNNLSICTPASMHALSTNQMFSNGRRDEDLFSVANALIKGGMHPEVAFQVIETIAKSWGEGDKKGWFSEKIQSALKRQDSREKSLANEVKEWILSTEGHFFSTEIHKELDLSTKLHKKNVSEILRRLCVDGLIERAGNKNGVFRRVKGMEELEEIDWENASTESLPIKWPLRIEKFVLTRPRNVVIVAGDSDSGKSAFLMNTIAMNPDFKVRAFISEGGASELNVRINNSGTPDLFKKPRVKFFFKNSEWADHVHPDAINIFDYLDPVGDDYPYVSQWIRDIYTRLKKGIAIIGLQKKIGADYGTGGPKTAEKSRLYLAIDKPDSKIRIVKGKNWADPTKKPDKLQCRFKLWKGYHFSIAPDGGWHKPEDRI